ncbi:methionyl-tRNA formyltransferase, mitochondrial [[Candida] railenensis]|uniref:Methionyl-tRNA formyltransferase, mitochondrial n=1 Tax=[Candida] railenensis TaxID=45579 RepID=A0A9P0QUI6_9ASCO|nr:methionyl-tRNA formyltransferase, mitochondrial [[Candida] railenensis]
MLRIAFFGSDIFSVKALSTLLDAKSAPNNNLISSLDVITRSIKPQGRKRILTDVPIGTFATNANLPVHRADSRDQILQLSEKINPNLTIAVSYGKLIPADFISKCEYGGLNVHPSLLPKYSGSSPIQYAIRNGDQTTGVTIQTLHPTKFDRGEIIAQSGEVDILENENYDSLLERLGKLGSDMLIQTLQDGLYKSPITPIIPSTSFSLAPRISPSESEILWNDHTTKSVINLYKSLGPLHTFQKRLTKKKKNADAVEELYKVIFSDIKIYTGPLELSQISLGAFHLDSVNDRLLVKTKDGAISVGLVKFQYQSYESPTKFVSQTSKRCGVTSSKTKFIQSI